MSVDMQLQMRRNIEQMHSAVGDLDDWLGDIGKRDASLRGIAPTGGMGTSKRANADETDDEEEAREIEEAKEELRKLTAAEAAASDQMHVGSVGSESTAVKTKSKGPLTHAQKYGQWEQYDADKIVASMEAREADQERLRREVTRLENQRAQARARKAAAAAAAAADALRLQGNEAFGAARYEEAVGLYTDGLGHAPRSALLYSNRALALLKLHAYDEAEEDCDAALSIDAASVKALLRRAQARHALAKYEGALEDLELALEQEPRNSAARSLMQECRRLKSLQTPRPKPQMTRVEVQEVTHDPDNDGDAFVLAQTPTPAESVSESQDQPALATVADDKSQTSEASAHADADAQAQTSDKPQKAAEGGVGGMRSQRSAVAFASKAPPKADAFPLPMTQSDMERAWRSLRATPEEFAAYVRLVDPEKMRSLFKANLPSELFSAIIAALDEHLSKEDAPRTLAIMRALAAAGRFSILIMCLDKADRNAIDAINLRMIEAQGAGLLPAEEDLGALRKAYA